MPKHPVGSPTLVVRWRRMPAGLLILEMCGEVDLVTEDVMAAALADAVGADVRLLVCDMTRVSFLGCVGLTVLLRAKEALRDRDAQLRVVARSPTVVMMFELTDLVETLGLCANLGDATGG